MSQLQAPQVEIPSAAQQPPQRAITARSLFTGLALSVIWILAICYMVVYISTYTYQLLMILGFGGLLTIFLLQYPRLYLGTLVGCWAGTAALAWSISTPVQQDVLAWGLLRSLPVLAVLVLIGVMQAAAQVDQGGIGPGICHGGDCHPLVRLDQGVYRKLDLQSV